MREGDTFPASDDTTTPDAEKKKILYTEKGMGDGAEKIRVLHVAQAAGGVDRYLRMLLKYLDPEKFENILVCSQDFREKDYEGLVSHFEEVEMLRPINYGDIPLIFTIRRLIRKYHPDIVYAHSSKAGAVTRVADIGMGNVCIYNPHGWAFNMRTTEKRRKLYTRIERMAAPFCEKIVCISEEEKSAALRNGICSDEKLKVIRNGVDIAGYEESPHNVLHRANLKIPDDAFVVGIVGRLTRQKSPDIVIQAAVEIKKEIPEAYFLFVGNGGMEEQVKKYAREHGLEDSLSITGWVDNPLDYVELFDIGIMLSRWEGFGLALPEYMMVGKPIIATRVDAIPEIVTDGENGILIEEDNVEQTVQAILKLYQNPDLREAFVASGRQHLGRFDAKRVAKEHEEVFLSVYRSN